MKRETVSAKDGNPTVLIDGKLLHSKYAPRREAARAADMFSRETGVLVLFVIGEGVPYLSTVIAKRHPDMRVYAVLLGAEADERSYETEREPDPLPEHICAETGEEEYVRRWVRERLHPLESGNVQAYVWPPTESAAPEWIEATKRSVFAGVQDLHSELATVASFGRLWLKNALRRTIATDYRLRIQPDPAPIVLVGGGPGVAYGSHFIAAHRRAFTIIAATSATTALAAHGITPDIAFHTDAGFWAQRYRNPIRSDGHDVPTVIPLRASMQAGVPFPTSGEVLVRHGWFGEALAPDAMEWQKILEAPTVTASMISWIREHASPTDVYLLGIDLCSYDLSTHAAPHPNDRYIAAGASRLRPEITLRAVRSGYVTGQTVTDLPVLRWSDGTAGFQTPALQAFVQPVRTMISTLSRTHTVKWIVPSPLWPNATDATRDHDSGEITGSRTAGVLVHETRRPDIYTRRNHAIQVLNHWSEMLDGGVHAVETQDILLHLAPVATLRERRGDEAYPGAVEVARAALTKLKRFVADG